MSTILVGSAPDSWGVWFPDDPNQTPYTRFLDEVAASGYEWIELGPFGYLPTDPKKLSAELAAEALLKNVGSGRIRFVRIDRVNQILNVEKHTLGIAGRAEVGCPVFDRQNVAAQLASRTQKVSAETCR